MLRNYIFIILEKRSMNISNYTIHIMEMKKLYIFPSVTMHTRTRVDVCAAT